MRKWGYRYSTLLFRERDSAGNFGGIFPPLHAHLKPSGWVKTSQVSSLHGKGTKFEALSAHAHEGRRSAGPEGEGGGSEELPGLPHRTSTRATRPTQGLRRGDTNLLPPTSPPSPGAGGERLSPSAPTRCPAAHTRNPSRPRDTHTHTDGPRPVALPSPRSPPPARSPALGPARLVPCRRP